LKTSVELLYKNTSCVYTFFSQPKENSILQQKTMKYKSYKALFSLTSHFTFGLRTQNHMASMTSHFAFGLRTRNHVVTTIENRTLTRWEQRLTVLHL